MQPRSNPTVWTPIGSMFSMLHMTTQVSSASRITSYSSSFQPISERSTSTWPTGRELQAVLDSRSSSSRVSRTRPCAAQREGRR